MNDFIPFSERHGLTPPDAPITIRAEAPDWLRNAVVDFAYKAHIRPSRVRALLCAIMLESPDSDNRRADFVDSEVRELLTRAEWFQVYDLIEHIVKELSKPFDSPQLEEFTGNLNAAFRQKGVGWQLVDGRIEVRGDEPFEVPVRSALDILQETGRPHAQQELHEALRDLSRRPEPDLTGAVQHAMAALECVARDLTGEPNLTLGEWLKKHPTAFPQPLGSALDKLWGYASQYGRHVQEGKPANYDEAELVVGLAGALTVYLLRRVAPFPA